MTKINTNDSPPTEPQVSAAVTVVKFPDTLPPAERLDNPRAQLLLLVDELTTELEKGELRLMTASRASELAAATRKIADKVAEANSSLAAISETIRKSWGL
jgi:hypothetical protein